MTDHLGARWRRIYSNEWFEPAFRDLDDSERVVYFYARTGPQSTSVGIYRMSTAVAVEDIGNLTAIEFDHRLDVICQAFGWRFDSATRVLWIPDWLHENPPQSPNVCVAWRKLIANLPDCGLKFEAAAAITQYLKDKPKAFLEAFGKDFPKDTRISKAKTKAQPESNQGAGDSGIQGSERKRAGALARGGLREKGQSPQPSRIETDVVKLARQAVEMHDGPIDEVLDVMHNVNRCQKSPVVYCRADAVAAINIALAERRNEASA